MSVEELLDDVREDALAGNARRHRIPDYMVSGLILYIIHHIAPGRFLRFVLENNLAGAVGYADSTNIHILDRYVKFLEACAPMTCYGSPEMVKAWLEKRG